MVTTWSQFPALSISMDIEVHPRGQELLIFRPVRESFLSAAGSSGVDYRGY